MPRSVERRMVAGSTLPKVSAVVVSLILHASTAAGLVLSAIPADPPLPEPQPMAIMVEMVPEPAVEEQLPQTVAKGDRMEAMVEQPVPEEPAVEPEPQPETPVETEVITQEVEQAPEAVPVPVRRPKPEKPKKEPTRVAEAKGLPEEPQPDMPLGETQRAPGRLDAVSGEETAHGIARNTPTQQRWQMRLAAHLERRKRYPKFALSKHSEGTVYVRFQVAPDGTVAAPELVRSSGVPDLDQEVIDLIQRASPLPVPPEDVNTLVVVPINFSIRR